MLGYRKIMSQLPVWYTLIVISLLKQSSTVLSIDRELDLLMKCICFCLLLGIKSKNSDFEEAVARKCLVKKVFLKISQNS